MLPLRRPAGELCIEAAAPDGSQPAAPAGVRQLSCTLDAPGGLGAKLAWQPAQGGCEPRCYHIWCCWPCSPGQDPEWRWVGTARCCAYCLSLADAGVPRGASTAAFAVQPEGANGLLQELAAAARVTVSLDSAEPLS